MRPADTQKRSSRYKMTKVFISSRLSLHCSTIIVQIIQFFFCVFPVRSCFHEPVDGQQVSCKLSVGLGSFLCVCRSSRNVPNENCHALTVELDLGHLDGAQHVHQESDAVARFPDKFLAEAVEIQKSISVLNICSGALCTWRRRRTNPGGAF